MILIYTTCVSVEEAQKIGKHILKKRLAACVNIYPEMQSISWWPPGKNKLIEAEETVLIIKTTDDKYNQVEEEILKIHSYETPAIFVIPASRTYSKYLDWIEGEIR